ncbi:MAG: UDP-3-O-(3-hydroxymyristoyl)glucosamine N-acyltransferase [Ghiorsea sp.]|nr:UDP-3-O-(3-hydroxymyristoyl)glucosamine N-acyltransferase [Ghiorsea sp.]
MKTFLTVSEAAELVAGRLIRGDGDALIEGLHTLAHANRCQASFLANMKYKSDLLKTKAGLVLLSGKVKLPQSTAFSVIIVADPYVAFTRLQQYFHPSPLSTGMRHQSAAIDDSTNIAEGVQIDAHVSIGANVSIGKGSIIGAGCVLEEDVSIGEGCLIHPRVTLAKGSQLGDRVIIQSGAVIGSDGFGFAWTGEEYLKIPQVGCVVLEDDVEIGANTCIDRGAIDNTVIKAGAKLDNLIQIAHNVEIGYKTVIAGQVGIAGSTVIGKGCQMGAQSGVAGHLKLTDGTIVGAKAGVIGDTKQAGMISGFPAVPHRQWLRASGIFDRLPEVWKKIRKLSEGEG